MFGAAAFLASTVIVCFCAWRDYQNSDVEGNVLVKKVKWPDD